MKAHSASIEIRRPADEVFAYLADLRNEPQWRRDVQASELASGEPGAGGARYRQSGGGKKASSYTIEVTQLDPSARALRFATLDAAPVAVRGGYRVAGDGAASTATVDVELHPGGVVKLFEPFMGPSLRRTTANYLADLKAQLERNQ